jgi:hypothetical protein
VAAPARTGREVGVGRPPRHHFRQGTAVTKKYQNEKIDMPDALGIAVPERVSVAMEETPVRCGRAGLPRLPATPSPSKFEPCTPTERPPVAPSRVPFLARRLSETTDTADPRGPA